MNAMERAGYLAYGKTRRHLARVQRARATIRSLYCMADRSFVSFSAGKDSSAMLWLVLDEMRHINVRARILTGGETRILYPSLDGILALWRSSFSNLTLDEVHVDHVFADGWETATWREQWESFIGGWTDYLWNPAEWDGIFIGLRADESNTRRLALKRRVRGMPYAIYRYQSGPAAGSTRACPLDRWSDDDVAAVIVTNGIPLLEPYEVEGMAARTHYRTGYTSLRMGQLVELRRRDPAGYNRLIQRFPELNQWGG